MVNTRSCHLTSWTMLLLSLKTGNKTKKDCRYSKGADDGVMNQLCQRVSISKMGSLSIIDQTERTKLCVTNLFYLRNRMFLLLNEFCDSYIVNLWNLVNKISGETIELGSWYLDCVQGVDDMINLWQILCIISWIISLFWLWHFI